MAFDEETSDLDTVFASLLERKLLPSVKNRFHRFALADEDSLIFETNADDLDSVLYEVPLEDSLNMNPFYKTINLSYSDYRIYATPFKTMKGDYYQLIVVSSLDKLYESLYQFRSLLFVIFPVSIFLAGFIGFLIARKALKPVMDITHTAARISSTNLGMRVEIGKSQDELSELASTFNEMITRLDSTFKSQHRFLADASHDIRTPLTIIQTELEILRSREDLRDYCIEPIDKSLQEISRLSRLTDCLLIFARADSNQLVLDKTNLRLDEEILDSLRQLSSIANARKIKFTVNIDNPVEISADEAHLRRILINIIENSIKYSPENSTVKIDLTSEASFHKVSVNNRGKSISPEILPYIFDRFQRGDTSRSTSGFGLGLAIARTLVNLHHGSISAESDENHGTTINMYFRVDENEK